MSASETKAAETSKDTDDKKAGPPRNIIRIRLPPRKRLSSGLLTLSKKVPEDTNKTRSKKVSEQTNDNPSKNLITSAVQTEASSNSPREGLCNVANSNILINIKLPEVASDSNPSKNLTIATGVQGDNAGIFPAKIGLCEEANNNILSKALAVAVKELSAKPISNTPSKFLTTTGVQGEEENKNTPSKKLRTTRMQGEEENDNSPRKRLLYDTDSNTPSKVVHEEAKNDIPSRNLPTTVVECEEVFEQANNHIPTKRLSDEAKNNALSNRPTDPHPANKSSPLKKLRNSAVQDTPSKNTYGMKLSSSAGKAVKQSTNAANLEAIKEYQEFEEKVKRTVYLDNLSPQATKAVINSALSQFGTLKKVNFLVNYTIPYDIPQSALVEMETEKDAEYVVNMLHEFPFMMSGMPRPVGAKRATAEMFNDRPRRPGRKLEFRWVGPTDPDHEIIKELKLMSRRHEVENLALVEHELEQEKLLAEQQQESLNCNYLELETVAGMPRYALRIAEFFEFVKKMEKASSNESSNDRKANSQQILPQTRGRFLPGSGHSMNLVSNRTV